MGRPGPGDALGGAVLSAWPAGALPLVTTAVITVAAVALLTASSGRVARDRAAGPRVCVSE